MSFLKSGKVCVLLYCDISTGGDTQGRLNSITCAELGRSAFQSKVKLAGSMDEPVKQAGKQRLILNLYLESAVSPVFLVRHYRVLETGQDQHKGAFPSPCK